MASETTSLIGNENQFINRVRTASEEPDSEEPQARTPTRCSKECKVLCLMTIGFILLAIVILMRVASVIILEVKQCSTPIHNNTESEKDILSASPYENEICLTLYKKINLIIIVMIRLLNLPELWYLFRGYYKFSSTPQGDTDNGQTILQKCRKTLQEYIEDNVLNVLQKIIRHAIIFLVFIIYLMTGVVPPALSIFTDEHDRDKYKIWVLWIGYIHDGFTFLFHVCTWIVRCFIVFKCGHVNAIFRKGRDNISTLIIVEPRNPSPSRIASKVHKTLSDEYQCIAVQVAPILQIFSSWFIFTWIIYSLGTIDRLATLIRAWTAHESLSKTGFVYEIFYLIYDFLSYSIAYVYVMEFNVYHEEYYDVLLKRQTEGSSPTAIQEDEERKLDIYSETIKMSLKKRKDCDFVPSLWGIKFPMDSVLYALPIIIPTISLIWGFIARID